MKNIIKGIYVVGTKIFNFKVIDEMVPEESGEVQFDACKWLTKVDVYRVENPIVLLLG